MNFNAHVSTGYKTISADPTYGPGLFSMLGLGYPVSIASDYEYDFARYIIDDRAAGIRRLKPSASKVRDRVSCSWGKRGVDTILTSDHTGSPAAQKLFPGSTLRSLNAAQTASNVTGSPPMGGVMWQAARNLGVSALIFLVSAPEKR